MQLIAVAGVVVWAGLSGTLLAYHVLPDRVELVSPTGDVRVVERAAFGLVELRQGPLQRLTGVASITIDLDAGDGERVKLSDVPKPDHQYERLRPEATGRTVRPRPAVGIARAVVIGSVVVTVFTWLFLVSLIDHKRGPIDALFGTGTIQVQGPNYRYDHDDPDRGDLKLRGLDCHEAVYDRLTGMDSD